MIYKKKYFTVAIFFVVFFLVEVNYLLADSNGISSKGFKQNFSQMANPASSNCINQGGVLKILESTKGQYGVCIFEDRSLCEEWAFLRGECLKGSCKMQCKKERKKKGWYDCHGNFLYEENCLKE